MSDELLPYYNRELAFLHRLGAEFAQAHPKIAGRLLLGPDTAGDPHVERLIEAFAYLNARTRHKLDDDFPEISDALLGVLYPHYQAPLPPLAVVQFQLDRAQGELTAGYAIPAATPLETDPIEGEPCRFRTAYPVTLWPCALESAALMGQPFSAPAISHARKSPAVLRLVLKCFSPDLSFQQLSLESLRFYLHGQAQHVFPLYEMLFHNVLGVALASSPADREPVVLGPECICPVGFAREEGLFPYPARCFLGYRLLTEYFAFPQKFLFFDLAGLSRQTLQKAGRELEIYFYFNRTRADLEQNVSETMFRLGCTPIVNLFPLRAEPIRITQTQTEYRVIPDVRRPLAHEIYSIDRVTAISPANEQVEYRPFYSFRHAADRRQQQTFWHAVRRPAGAEPGSRDAGTEVYLTLVDLGFSPSVPADWTLDVETTCLNRELAHHLIFREGHAALRLTGGAPISRIEVLTRQPTPTLRPALRRGALWRLISHLSLNHLSLVDSADGADALREILKLYDFQDSAETRSMIEGVLNVSGRRVVGRVVEGIHTGFSRGVEVKVHFDEDRFSGSSVFLFACVLERFLGLYCNLNSFSKLVVTTNRREGEIRRWPPRSGEAVLL
jgi:type VI secretion system protein ImpG